MTYPHFHAIRCEVEGFFSLLYSLKEETKILEKRINAYKLSKL
jgi:hypothetical protein